MTCKYALDDSLDLDSLKNHPRYRSIVKRIDSEQEWVMHIKELGLHESFYCKHSGMIELAKQKIYCSEGLPNKKGGYTKFALLGRIAEEDYDDFYMYHLIELDDIKQREENLYLKKHLKKVLHKTLRMCYHCKFYEPAAERN